MKKISTILLLLVLSTPAWAATAYYSTGTSGFPYVSYTFFGIPDENQAGAIDVLSNYNHTLKIWETQEIGFCLNPDLALGDGYAAHNDITGIEEAAWLFDNLWSAGNSTDQNAALQMVIWKSIYGNDFSVSANTDDNIEYWYDIWDDNLGKGYAYSGTGYRVLDFTDDSFQNIIVQTIPVPASITLLGAGVLLLGALRRNSPA